jgi:hypothetical protein
VEIPEGILDEAEADAVTLFHGVILCKCILPVTTTSSVSETSPTLIQKGCRSRQKSPACPGNHTPQLGS